MVRLTSSVKVLLDGAETTSRGVGIGVGRSRLAVVVVVGSSSGTKGTSSNGAGTCTSGATRSVVSVSTVGTVIIVVAVGTSEAGGTGRRLGVVTASTAGSTDTGTVSACGTTCSEASDTSGKGTGT